MRSRSRTTVLLVFMMAGAVGRMPAQERGPEPLTAQSIQTHIDSLGNLDFPVRMNAARALRRAPADTVVPALIRAVESHKDQFARFRALVLLTGFNDPRTPQVVQELLVNPNDRVRTVAYMYYEHHPSVRIVPELIRALAREESEFVRPALIRALAAHGTEPFVQKTLLAEVTKGQDFFRSAVIEALGDYRAAYALAPLLAIAKQDGPLQVDAIIALGKLKDQRAMDTLAGLQRTTPRETQPTIAAAVCLLGVNCDAHVPFLIETLIFADRNQGFQALLRNTVAGLVALSNNGDVRALTALMEVGIDSVDPPRAPLALGAGTVAIRNTQIMLAFLEKFQNTAGAISLIAEGFDMLEEDYEEERFFATVRQDYWKADDSSPARKIGQALIDKLEF